MVTYLILLFILQSTETRRAVPKIEIESQKITLSNRPRLGETVKVVYEVIPKKSKKNLKVIFYGFRGVKPISKDTIYHFNAVKGIRRKFSIDVEYISTPAIIGVKVEGAYSRISLTRYLLSSETGEYGTMREVQFNPPVEYRFNPKLRKFEFTVFNFRDDRWHKNRAIIDTIRNISPEITDSLALVLYADIPKVTYPQEITSWSDKAAYLLKQGWRKYNNDVDRESFLHQLKEENQIKNEENLRKLVREQQTIKRAKFLKWLMSWLIPVIILLVVLLVLLIIRGKVKRKAITSKQFDKLIVYAIYVIAISTAVYFAWPYLHVKGHSTQVWITKVRLRQKMRRVPYEIKRSNLLKDFSSYKLISENVFGTRSGFGADFTYLDKNSSEIGIEYYFTVKVWPTADGYQIRKPNYPPIKAIEQFEKNERVFSFLSKNEVKRAQLHFTDSLFSVTVSDTVVKDSIKIPLQLGYDGKSDAVLEYTVLSDFEDNHFPEIKTLNNLCNSWEYLVKSNTYIKGTWNGNMNRWHLTTFLEGGGNDTLHFSVSPENHFKYWWGPSPGIVELPDSIINQIYSEFSKAGLPPGYAREHIEVVSTRAIRQPNYFAYDQKDKVVVEAIFKWITGCAWVDEMNNGEGLQFAVVYEYFADSLKLGRMLAKSGVPSVPRHRTTQITPQYYCLRTIKQIIPKKTAWKELFNELPDEGKFNKIYLNLNIPKVPEDLAHFIILVGKYTIENNRNLFDIMVDLETGKTLRAEQLWHWREPKYEKYIVRPATPVGFKSVYEKPHVRLTWNRNLESGISGYRILRRQKLDPYPFSDWRILIDKHSVIDTVHIDSVIKPNRLYEYKVNAHNALGVTSKYSDIVQISIKP